VEEDGPLLKARIVSRFFTEFTEKEPLYTPKNKRDVLIYKIFIH
jgi:hypothetical protein